MCKEGKGLPLAGGKKAKGITSVDTNLGYQYPPKKVPFLEWEFQLMGPKDLLRRAVNLDIWSQALIVWMMRLGLKEVK